MFGFVFGARRFTGGWFFFCLSHSSNLWMSQWLQIHPRWHLLSDTDRKGCGNVMAEAESELGNSTQISVSSYAWQKWKKSKIKPFIDSWCLQISAQTRNVSFLIAFLLHVTVHLKEITYLAPVYPSISIRFLKAPVNVGFWYLSYLPPAFCLLHLSWLKIPSLMWAFALLCSVQVQTY